jgi:hypothetical protein
MKKWTKNHQDYDFPQCKPQNEKLQFWKNQTFFEKWAKIPDFSHHNGKNQGA